MSNCPSPESGQAGKTPSCQGCPNASACASAKPDPSIPFIIERLKTIKLIIAVMSGKGGVGKSTVAVGLASSIARHCLNVLLIDLDLTGPSILRMTGTDQNIIPLSSVVSPLCISDNFFVISPSHLADYSAFLTSSSKNALIKLIVKSVDLTSIDIVVLDTPPNISDEHIALAQYIRPNAAVMVTSPQNIAFADVLRQIGFCKKAGISLLGMVENMKYFACPKCGHQNLYDSGTKIKEFCFNKNIDYFGSIQLDQKIAKASDSGQSFQDEVLERVVDKIQNLIKDGRTDMLSSNK